jgi:hypothetical protein
VLAKAATIEVTVDPSLPSNREWQLWLYERTSRGADALTIDLIDSMGTIDGVPSGSYTARLMPADPSSSGREVLWGDVVEVPPAEVTSLRIRLQAIPFRGTLLLGEAPVGGHLVFQRGRLLRTFEADAETGRIEGLLSEYGLWDVRVRNPDLGISTGWTVEVNEANAADLVLTLPITRLEIRTLDSRRRPIAGAQVVIGGLDPDGKFEKIVQTAVTDDSGKWVTQGLAAGGYGVTSTYENADLDMYLESRFETLDLTEDGNQSLEVVLNDGRLVRVSSSQGLAAFQAPGSTACPPKGADIWW